MDRLHNARAFGSVSTLILFLNIVVKYVRKLPELFHYSTAVPKKNDGYHGKTKSVTRGSGCRHN